MSIVKNTLGFNASSSLPAEMTFTRNTTATRVNNIGNIETVLADAIRLDYSPSIVGKPLGWLLEESSTNTIIQSEDFTTTWGTSGSIAAVSPNATIAPNGSIVSADKADSITASSATTGRCSISQAQVWNSGQTYTVSVYAKKKDIDFLELSTNHNGDSTATLAQTFNLVTGAVGSFSGTSTNAKMVSYPNGWYRCEVSFVADGVTNPEIYIIARNDDANGTECTLNNQNGIYAWGMQVEALPYATSYIPTTDAAVTRASDDASVMTADSDFNWTVGASIVFEGTTFGGPLSPIFHYMDSGSTMGGNAEDNSVTYYNNGKLSLTAGGADQLANPVEATGFSITNGENFKAAVTFSPSRFSAAHNTVLAASPFPVAVSALPINVSGSDYTIKFFHGAGLPHSSGHVKFFRILPNGLSNNELQSVTTRQADLINDGQGGVGTVIYDASITAAKLIDGAITTAKLANNSVTSDKIAFEVVVAEDLANNTITTAKIGDAQVSGDKLATDSVDGTKISLASEATGDIMYYNGTDWVRLAKGTDGQVLKSSDTNTLEWGMDGDDGSDPFSPTSPLGDTAGSHVSGTITSTFINPNKVGITELNVTDGTNGQALMTNGNGTLSFGDVSADPTLGGDLSGPCSNAQIVALSVGNAELAADAVTNAKLADDAVQTENLVNLSVANAKLADDAVSSDKLRDSAAVDSDRAVTADHIRNLNVTTAKLANNAVTSDKILDSAVTSAKIADLSIVAGDLATNSVTNLKIAALSVTNSKISTDAITTLKIADDAVTADKLADDAVTAASIADGSITNAKIGAGAITSDKIALDIIVAEDLANNSVTAAEISANAITTDKIQDGAVTAAKLASGVIVAQTIAANAVNGTHLQMGSDAAGDILYYNGTDYVRLGAGSNGETLTLSGGIPSWAAASSGGVSSSEATATAVTMAVALG